MSELRLNTDGHIIKLGADNDVSLTHVADTGLLLNSTMQLQFNDASQNINAPSATVLDINATDEIELNATAVDLNGTLDVSGTLTQTGVATFSARSVHSSGITIADAGQIGSASDADSIAIASNGVVTFTQAPVFPDGSLAVADLDIDGATDIGAAIVDADLFIIDDGAGGTNRKVTASRLKTYAAFNADAAQVFNESSADVDFRIESNGNANMFFLDGGDNTIKVASPTNVPGLGVNPHLQVSASSPFISINTASADAGSGALIFTKGRSATVGTATVVQDNDSLGGIFWAAADGTDFTSAAASIKANIDGTPGGNDVPGEIVFATTADGAASATDRLTISAAGVVSLAASSKLSVGDTAPDCSIGGLTLNQGADDGEILTL